MNSVAMPLEFAPAEQGISPEKLAVLIGSRLCHDLISPLGAIGNGVELLELSGEFPGIARSSEMQLIAESIDAARNRINLFRMAFGQAAAEQRISASELSALLASFDRHGRIRVTFEASGDLPRREARLIMLALMCLETAMAWGGQVLICRGASGWRLVAEAARIKADPALWSCLDGRARMQPDFSPSEVHFALLAELVQGQARPLKWELDEAGGEISF